MIIRGKMTVGFVNANVNGQLNQTVLDFVWDNAHKGDDAENFTLVNPTGSLVAALNNPDLKAALKVGQVFHLALSDKALPDSAVAGEPATVTVAPPPVASEPAPAAVAPVPPPVVVPPLAPEPLPPNLTFVPADAPTAASVVAEAVATETRVA